MTVKEVPGFTLVEVIVALSVLSLIGVAVASAMSSTTRAVDRASNNIERSEDQRLANNYLRRQIALAIPRSSRKRGRIVAWFDGNESSMQWLAELPVHAAGGGIRALRLYQNDNNLMLDYALWGTELDSFTEVWRTSQEANITVLERVSEVRYAYLAPATTRVATPKWRATWTNQEVLPAAVRVSIVSEEGKHYPPVEIRLRARGRVLVRSALEAAGAPIPEGAEPETPPGATNTLPVNGNNQPK